MDKENKKGMRKEALDILQIITSKKSETGKNYEAYLVGGCVRDKRLNRQVKDYDITTNMPMSMLEKLFKTKDIGKQFGTLLILKGKYQYEITQYRTEVYRNDSRKPIVKFGTSLLEDLKRRDFTINAMAMDYNGKIYHDKSYDPYRDIADQKIRFVGNTLDRINEDPLRIMRAFRFAARYKFKIVAEDLEVIKQNKHLLSDEKKVSKERIQEELNKGIMLDRVEDYFKTMMKAGILSEFIPELQAVYRYEQKNSHHNFTLDTHLLKGVSRSPKDLKVRWAVLLHDIGKPKTASVNDRNQLSYIDHQFVGSKMAEKIMERLKFSNDMSHFVVNAVHRHMGTFDSYKIGALRTLYDIFKKDLPRFIQVKIGDYYGHDLGWPMINKINKMLDLHARVYQMMYEVIEDEKAFKKSDLKINGHDLKQLGHRPGPIFATILDDIFDKVINDELENRRDILISYTNENYKL